MGFFERLFRSRSRREEQWRAEQAARLARLRAPAWDRVEGALGRPVPAILRELYADQSLVTTGDLLLYDPDRAGRGEIPWNVNEFIPADEDALSPDLVSIPSGAFAFATNEFGDPFYVQLGELADGDGRVFVHYHDGDDVELVAPSLRTLLSWQRAPRNRPD